MMSNATFVLEDRRLAQVLSLAWYRKSRTLADSVRQVHVRYGRVGVTYASGATSLHPMTVSLEDGVAIVTVPDLPPIPLPRVLWGPPHTPVKRVVSIQVTPYGLRACVLLAARPAA